MSGPTEMPNFGAPTETNDNQLPPAESPHSEPQPRQFTLAEFLKEEYPQHGDMIVGLNARDLGALEEHICSRVDPSLNNPYAMRGLSFYGNPLQDQLKPRSFNGNLVEGIATLLVPGRVNQTGGSPLEAAQVLAGATFSPAAGILLSVIAGLKTSGKPVDRWVSRGVLYQQGKKRPSGVNGAIVGGVRRQLGTAKQNTAAELGVELDNVESALRARNIAATAIRHARSAGLPTLGRR